MQFTATLREPWHMYDLGPYENGPRPTGFVFDLPAGVLLEGPLTMDPVPDKVYDPLFDMLIGSFWRYGCI